MFCHGPECALAAINASFIQGIFKASFLNGIAEYCRIKQTDLKLRLHAKKLLHHGFLRSFCVMIGYSPEGTDNHSVTVRRILSVKFGTGQPFGCQLFDGIHDFLIVLFLDQIQNADASVKQHLLGICK